MPNDAPRFSIKARLKSFVYAWRGIIGFFRTEHNAQIHLVFSILVIILSIAFHISRLEVLFVIGCIALVVITEMVNTAIEKTLDLITREKHPIVGRIKDMAAGAVLIAAVAAVVTGLIIFLPKILMLVKELKR